VWGGQPFSRAPGGRLIPTKGPAVKDILAQLLQSDNPLRPWVFVIAACTLACFPRPSRRIGGLLLCAVLAVCGVFFFLQGAFLEFAPDKGPAPPAKKSSVARPARR